MQRRTTRTLLVCAGLALLGGCATLPPGAKPDPRDPWERMNRATYRFNDAFDKGVARPVARTYKKAVPQVARTGIRNFFDNVRTPLVMLNDLLQGQMAAFVNDTARLVINTTFGIGGLFDPATAVGLEKNDRDFGQTLGKWGVHKGPYVVLPFLGPSDVRDTVGRTGDTFSTPTTYLSDRYWRYGLWALDTVDLRAGLLDFDRLIDQAYDPYSFVRNAYLQNRDFKVNGSVSDSEEERERKLMEEASEDDTATAPAAPAAPGHAAPAVPAPPAAPLPPAGPQAPAPPPGG